MKWNDQTGSNRQPPGPQPGALPIELWPHVSALTSKFGQGSEIRTHASRVRGEHSSQAELYPVTGLVEGLAPSQP